MLLRMTRLKSALSGSENSEEVAKLLFCNRDGEYDMRLSVYDVLDSQSVIIQISAEHMAHCKLKPEHLWCLDLSNSLGVMVVPCPDGGCFVFRNNTHCEMLFNSHQQIHQLAAQLLLNHQQRYRQVGKSNIHRYAHDCFIKNDAEWLSVCMGSTKVSDWVSRKPTP
jgi:hypothetical protein